MNRMVIATDKAPAAVGPYSQAVRIGDFVFVSGEIAIVPGTGKLAEGGIEAETHQVLQNISAILEAGHSSVSQVIKTTVFLQNMSDFTAMNVIYAQFFPANPPARSTLQVTALPLGALVAIEAVAVIDNSILGGSVDRICHPERS